MRRIIALEWMSLDGFIAGNNGQTDWFSWDRQLEEFYKTQQSGFDTILYGRTTYGTMSRYWPTADASQEDPEIVAHMNDTLKFVFSKTLNKTAWANSHILRKIDEAEITKMKSQVGKDIVVYGSSAIVSQLVRLSLIDELRIMSNPIVLGTGVKLFQAISGSVELDLVNTQAFDSGCMLLCYKLKKNTLASNNRRGL
jgi:dihydrofolate reductase